MHQLLERYKQHGHYFDPIKLIIKPSLRVNTLKINEEELIKRVKDITDGYGPDVVVEAVGIPDVWELSTKLVKRGGLVNFFGGCKKGSRVKLDTYRLHYDELKLIGVFHHTPEYVQIALNLIKNSLISQEVFRKIITHTVPLQELKKALLMHESGEAIQIAVKP